MKRCSECKQWKSKSCFNKRSRAKDGLNYSCKSCIKVYNKTYSQEHKKEIEAYNKAHNKRNYQNHYHHQIWYQMIRRCTNPKHKDFKYYGGRGIKVCNRWMNSFDDFFKDVGPRPSSKHSIDRINNNGNYEPGNCKWSTRVEQNRNKRPYKKRKH